MKEKEVNRTLPENYATNLSDFALFLSVMKNKEAYECVLSIILEEENLQLAEVQVEQVILNESGKRAIRLDAWALDTKNRQINTEMQNDTDNDDVRKRARYYQALMDAPILKSGKQTKYKHLPSTIIILLHRKIFLETRMDNPEIIVRDKRIEKLDSVVSEVKQSEEWEEVRMSIMKYALEQGRQEGIRAFVEACKELGVSRKDTLRKAEEKFEISHEQAENYMKEIYDT